MLLFTLTFYLCDQILYKIVIINRLDEYKNIPIYLWIINYLPIIIIKENEGQAKEKPGQANNA